MGYFTQKKHVAVFEFSSRLLAKCKLKRWWTSHNPSPSSLEG